MRAARIERLILMGAVAVACDGGNTTPPDAPTFIPKGSRILSLDVRPAEHDDYTTALNQARAIGVEQVTFALDWGTVETAPGQFDLTNVDIANTYYPQMGVKVAMSVRPVSTNYRTMPPDLMGLPLDDANVIARFNAWLDVLHEHLGGVALTGIYIGSEHDVSFGTDPVEWARWQRFWDQTRPHAKALWPTVPIGTEFTFESLTQFASTETARSNADADVIVVSYYPLGSGFQVMPPAAVKSGFDQIASRYPNRKVHYNQIGYPSSATNGSNEELQRQFVAELFRAWDAHASSVDIVNIVWQTDLSQAEVEAFEELYNLHDPAFAEYLRTLGLRTYAGADKPAWTELGARADERGW